VEGGGRSSAPAAAFWLQTFAPLPTRRAPG
jgi:hypothetical protein